MAQKLQKGDLSKTSLARGGEEKNIMERILEKLAVIEAKVSCLEDIKSSLKALQCIIRYYGIISI